MRDVATTVPRPRVRLDYLHGLRGLAALAVVLLHCAQLAQADALVAPPWPLQLLRNLGSLAVPTFIVLSGYCLALPVVRSGRPMGGAWGFMKRRARRILPAYYGALALSLLCAVTLTHTLTLAGVPGAALGPLLLVHDCWGSANAFDVPLWSLAVEWHIYWCVPALCWLWRRYGALRCALVGLLLPLLALPLTNALGLTHGMWPHLYTLFVMGALGADTTQAPARAAPCARRLRLRWGQLSLAILALSLGAVMLGGWGGAYAAHRIPFQLAWGAGVVCLLVHLGRAPAARPARVLGSVPLVRLGEVSYSLYLLHWVPVSVLGTALAGWGPAAHLGGVPRVFVLAALGVPASLGLAAASWRLLERPYLHGRPAAAAGHPSGAALRSGLAACARAPEQRRLPAHKRLLSHKSP